MTRYVYVTVALCYVLISGAIKQSFSQDIDLAIKTPPSDESFASSCLFTPEEKSLIASNKVFKVCNVIQQANNEASLGIVKLIANKSGLSLRLPH